MAEPEVSVGPAPAPDIDQLVYLLPPEVDPVCNAAVDPLEIAAALEAAGVSNRVAQTTFGRPDLFTLAEELYDARTGRTVPLHNQPRPPRSGGVADLALGLLFVVPVVSLTVAGPPCTWCSRGGPFPWPSPSAGPSARPWPGRPWP